MKEIVALAGGVGGAKLAHGLYRALPPDSLAVVVNTGDDFTHWGLHISPDLDTVMYTLAGVANEATGWGVKDETWNALDAIGRLDAPTWFRIGDRDLATHVVRTAALREGRTLTEATAALSRALGIAAHLLPMTDDAVPTFVQTPDGWLPFQDYFVRRGHRDLVLGVRFDGIERASVPQTVRDAVARADAIIFCPSNPLVSIGPILDLPAMRDLLRGRDVPRVAVSPIVGGRALKGPADTMLGGMGHESSALGVARLYGDVLTGLVIDERDAHFADPIRALGLDVLVVNTVMQTVEDRQRLAEMVLGWCDRGGGRRAA
jgi:LPPG:FO 2-phospho-L-lactate transferase